MSDAVFNQDILTDAKELVLTDDQLTLKIQGQVIVYRVSPSTRLLSFNVSVRLNGALAYRFDSDSGSDHWANFRAFWYAALAENGRREHRAKDEADYQLKQDLVALELIAANSGVPF